MALQPNKVVVQFRGLETKVDDKQAVPGDLVLLENVIFDTLQEMRKRYGYHKLAQAARRSGVMLAALKNELLLADGRRLYGFTQSGLVDKGVYEPLNLSVKSIAKNSYAQQMPDSARHSDGCTVFAWESVESGNTYCRYSIIDNDTGQALVVNRKLGINGIHPKVVVLGAYVYVFYAEAFTHNLNYIRILASSPLLDPVAGTVAPNVRSGLYDVTTGPAAGGGTQAYVVFASYANTISGMRILPTLSHTASVVLSSATSPEALTVFERGDGLGCWVSYGLAGDLHARAFTQALLPDSSDYLLDSNRGQVRNVTGTGVDTKGFIFYECYDPLNGASVRRVVASLTSGLLLSGLFLYRAGLAAKVFRIDSSETRFHVPLATSSPLQSTYFVASTLYDPVTGFTSPVMVAKVAYGVGGGFTFRPGLGEVSFDGVRTYSFAYLRNDRLISTSGGLRTQSGVEQVSLTWDRTRDSLELGDTLLLTGGVLSAYDGAAVAEHGFHVYPEGHTAASVANVLVADDPTQTGSSEGAYQTCVVYEWMDNAGLLHQSSPSPVVAVQALAGRQFNYQIPTYTFGAKNGPVSIAVYRTLVNQAVFFRVTSVALPLLNDTSAPEVRFSEAIPDSLLSANAQLLSNPLNSLAEVPSIASDAPRFVTRYRNRAVVIPAEAPGQWQYSKAAIPGVPVEFNPQQFFNPVQGGGVPLTCAIEMDDKLILFANDRIYWTSGDGPAPNGTGNDYGNAFRVPSDVGCSNPRSVVLTPLGVFFQSAKGIYLLGRDLSVQYIGASVERFNSLTVTSATLVPNSRRVVFTMQSEDAIRASLVYDYFVQKWAVWTNYAAADALNFQGLLTHLREDGTVLQETPGSFADDSSRYFIRARTSWLSFAGLSGFQRVWRFILRGTYRGAHKLFISVAFDDDPAPAQNVEVDATQVLTLEPSYGGDKNISPVAGTTLAGTDDPGGGQFANYEWQVKLLRQKSTSVQVTITEGPLDAPNEGLSISVLTFLVGTIPTLRKLPRSHNLTPGTPSAAPARRIIPT